MQPIKTVLLATVALTLPILATAGSSSKHHTAMQVQAQTNEPVQTSGQAAFAEIAQIVAELRADPNTDWTTVDIDGLRAHLIDMNNVTLHAKVYTEDTERGAIFTVSGETQEVVQSIKSMTIAHGMMMSAEELEWTTEEQDNGAVVTVEAKDLADAAMVRGLGLFGLMTLGDHHAIHHRMMASGRGHH